MVKNEASKSAVISIYNEIGFWGINAKDFRDQLKSLGELSNIELRINSPGGDVIDGFAIYNMLMQHSARIVAVIDGWAASMASIIAMAADEIHMPSNTWLMIHNPWSMTMGDKEELRKMADILEKMEGHAVQAYKLHSKLGEEEIAALMNAETWMDGKEAVEKGFAEVLLDEVQIAASVHNSKKLKAPAAAMAWVKAETTETPTPATEEKTEKETEKPEETTGGTENGTETAKADTGTEGAEKTIEQAKPADAAAKLAESKAPEAAATLPPEIMAKIDAAYDEGEAVGFAQAMKEAGVDVLKAQIQARDEENKKLKDQMAEYDVRLSKLGSGLNASSSSSEVAPATWEEALKKFDYAEARKKFPALYTEYRQKQRNSRK